MALPMGRVRRASEYSLKLKSAVSPARAPFLAELALGGERGASGLNGFRISPRATDRGRGRPGVTGGRSARARRARQRTRHDRGESRHHEGCDESPHFGSPVTFRSNRCAFPAAGAESSCPSAPKYVRVPPVTP